MRWLVLAALGATGCNRLLELERVSPPPAGRPPGEPAWVAGKDVAAKNHAMTVGVTFDAPATVGNMMVVAVGTFRATLSTVEDSAGNPYYITALSPADSQVGQTWIALAPIAMTADPFVVTATALPTGIASDVEVSVTADEYAGVPAATAPASSAKALGTTLKTNCGEITVAKGDLVFAAITVDGGGAIGPGSGFVVRHDPTTVTTTQIPLAVEDALQAPEGGLTPSFQISSATGWGCEAITVQ